MQRITLGSSGLKVSPVCLGTWQFNGRQADINWEPFSDNEAKTVVDKALELGVNFIDTAEAYTNSEVCLGRILGSRRGDVVLASKFGYKDGKTSYRAEDVDQALTASLASLQTDYLDIYQVHWPNIVADFDDVVAELKRQQARGRIRHYAVSNFGCKNMTDILKAGGIPLTNQLPYNLLWRAIEDSILPKCRENNISILAYSPLQQGLLTGKFPTVESVPEGRRRSRHFKPNRNEKSRHGQSGAEEETFQAIKDIKAIAEEEGVSMTNMALSWLLQQNGVTSVVVGAKNAKQVEENCKIVKLSEEVLAKLDACTSTLKTALGPVADQWSAQSRSV